MYKNRLANFETYYKHMGNYEVETSLSVYEVYIELAKDKDGNFMKNRDGSDRYYALDDASISTLDSDKLVKVIREGFYKDVFQVNGEYVEKVERNGKRAYYRVEEDALTTLAAGTKVVARNGTYRVPSEVGYVLMDERDIEHPKMVAVRKFKTDDHKAEAEKIVKGKAHKDENND
ncbi:MAG: hypothetical protein MJZ37_03845 [Bacilli bacterium]|nr:hypothetical protein [Bacilli bacterium]